MKFTIILLSLTSQFFIFVRLISDFQTNRNITDRQSMNLIGINFLWGICWILFLRNNILIQTSLVWLPVFLTLFIPKVLKYKNQKHFKSTIIPFLDLLTLRMAAGVGLRQAFPEVIRNLNPNIKLKYEKLFELLTLNRVQTNREHMNSAPVNSSAPVNCASVNCAPGSSVQAANVQLISPTITTYQSSQYQSLHKNLETQLDPVFKKFLGEIRKVEADSHLAVLRVKQLRKRYKKEKHFLDKRSRALSPVYAQILVMSIIYSLATLYVFLSQRANGNAPILLSSFFLFLIGFYTSARIIRSFKWKV